MLWDIFRELYGGRVTVAFCGYPKNKQNLDNLGLKFPRMQQLE
jgi:hypothetical protein